MKNTIMKFLSQLVYELVNFENKNINFLIENQLNFAQDDNKL